MWVDHLRRSDVELAALLDRGGVVMHPFIVGEIACGSLSVGKRAAVLRLLQDLPQALVADDEELLGFVEHHALHGKGIGYVDVHLLASVALSGHAGLWTRDKSLLAAAQRMGLAYRVAAH